MKKVDKSPLIAGLFFAVLSQSFAEAGSLSQPESSQSKDVGRIVGRVWFAGKFEKPAPLEVFKNRDFCGLQVLNESLLVGPRGGVQNVVVTIPGVRLERKACPFKTLVLDNKSCALVPDVQVAPVGSEILLLNSDSILHDVHARLGSETLFNEGLPTWRQVTKRLTRPGLITVQCEVLHTWMSAYILVTSSPYFVVTDGKGKCVIENVPVGTREIKAWHEKPGTRSKTLALAAGTTLHVDFVYEFKKRGT